MLTLHALSRQSPGGTLFAGLGITLLPGCLLHLSGPSGCGKTALLEIIAGNSPLKDGQITFAGQDTRGDREFFADLIYLPQNQADHLPKRMTVRKYLQKQAAKMHSSLMEGAINYFNLHPVLDQKIRNLSPGWRQRVALAPLILDPSAIWLLDRPFQSLDEEGKIRLEHLIAGRCQQNGIVIVVHEDASRLNAHHRLDLGDYAAPA